MLYQGIDQHARQITISLLVLIRNLLSWIRCLSLSLCSDSLSVHNACFSGAAFWATY
jgi:hypothetical protein